jgi:hypothetical protein
MQLSEENKFQKYLKELIEFQNQGENINVEKFESWKMKICSELSGNYKIRFNQLRFYTISEEIEYDDDLPF